MKALVVKELAGLGVFLLAGVIAVGAVVLDAGGWGSWRMWVLPQFRDAEILMGIALIGGFVLGFASLFGEQVQRTYEYLVHRPVGLAGIVGAKLIACGAIAVAWLLLPLLLQFVLFGLWDPGLQYYRFERLGVFLAFWTQTLSAAAAGLFVAALRAHPLFRFGIAAVLLPALLACSWLCLSPAGGAPSAAVFAAVHLLAAGLLCLATWWTLREGADPDLPASVRRTAVSALSLGAAAVLAGGLAITSLQQESLYGLYRAYPAVARTADGKVVLRRWQRGLGTVLFDQQHRPITGSQEAAAKARTVWSPWDLQVRQRDDDRFWPWRGWRQDVTGFFAAEQPLRVSLRRMEQHRYTGGDLFFDRRSSRLRAYWRGDAEIGIDAKVVEFGRGPDAEPFRGDVLVARVGAGEVLVVDLGDRSLWLLSDSRAKASDRVGLQPVTLPGDDRFVEPLDLSGTSERIVFAALQGLDDFNREFFVRGERGVYYWRDGGFAAVPNALAEKAIATTRRPEQPEVPVRVVDRDPLTPVVEVLDDQCNVVGRHAYALHTAEEMFHGFTLHALSLLRAPLLQVASFASEAGSGRPFGTSLEGGRGEIRDPLLQGGRRPGLLLLTLLLGAACAWAGMRRLSRLGAPANRRLLWSAFLFAGGPLVLLTHCVLERPRAYWPTPVKRKILLRAKSSA